MDDVSPNTTNDVSHNTTEVSRDTTDAPVDVMTAAERLGISEEAVRARIRRGKLRAEKVGALWQVYLSEEAPGASSPPSRDTTHQPVTQQNTTTDDVVQHDTPSADTNLSPLVEMVREQNQRIEQLSAAAAMWQTRAMHLEEQLKQLSATAESTSEAVEQPERAETDEEGAGDVGDGSAPQEGVCGRLVRLLTGR